MKRQVAGKLLIAGALFCALLTGCAGEGKNGENAVVSLEDFAVDMGGVGENSQEKAVTEKAEEGSSEPGEASEEGKAENAGAGQNGSEQAGAGQNGSDSPDMDFESAKELLTSMPDSAEELRALEAEYPIYMILHGKQDSGAQNLEAFRQGLEDRKSAKLLVVQFTVEGDAILDYYFYDGEKLYCWEDISRDAFGGTGEKYFEKRYDSAWFSEEADTEGELYLFFYGLYEGDMVIELFRADMGEKAETFTMGDNSRPEDGKVQNGEDMQSVQPSFEADNNPITELPQEKQPLEAEKEICYYPLAE